MKWLTAPFRYLAFVACCIGYGAYLIVNELSIPVRKWWQRTWRK